jgi:hypothetical protein
MRGDQERDQGKGTNERDQKKGGGDLDEQREELKVRRDV